MTDRVGPPTPRNAPWDPVVRSSLSFNEWFLSCAISSPSIYENSMVRFAMKNAFNAGWRARERLFSDDPQAIVPLLRAMATSTDAIENRHDTILIAAAAMIEAFSKTGRPN